MTDIISPLEQALTHAEDVFDALDQSAIAEAIPFVERAVKLWRAAGKFRDALLARKLLSFIDDPSLQTPEARAEMRKRVDSEDRKKIGETLFLVLERLNDMQKPEWLAKSYAAHLGGAIRADEFSRLASAIDIAFSDDLVELINSPETLVGGEPWMRNLHPAGLTDFQIIVPIGGAITHYRVTELGKQFKKAACAATNTR